jgi:hypothetical protein
VGVEEGEILVVQVVQQVVLEELVEEVQELKVEQVVLELLILVVVEVEVETELEVQVVKELLYFVCLQLHIQELQLVHQQLEQMVQILF